MSGFHSASGSAASGRFDAWLRDTVGAEPRERDERLADWTKAPGARESHPREEHLLPLMVIAGAAGSDRGEQIFRDEVMGVVVSAAKFGP